MRTGVRAWKSELSSIDTALLLAGVLTARQYYRHEPEIYRYATTIYERIDFPWMLNDNPTLLAMGWHPESGFIKARWDNYSEHTMLYLMAITLLSAENLRSGKVWRWFMRNREIPRAMQRVELRRSKRSIASKRLPEHSVTFPLSAPQATKVEYRNS
jgi:hypothetical protein